MMETTVTAPNRALTIIGTLKYRRHRVRMMDTTVTAPYRTLTIIGTLKYRCH